MSWSHAWLSKALALVVTLGPPGLARAADKPSGPARLDRLGDPLPSGAFARIGTTRLWTRWDIPPLAYSPDGKIIASGEYDGKVHLWDPATGKELRCLDGRTGDVPAIAFSPDSRLLAATTSTEAGKDGRVLLWEVATGRLVHQWLTGTVYAVAFSPDGKTLASGGGKRGVILWDPVTGQQRKLLAHARGVS